MKSTVYPIRNCQSLFVALAVTVTLAVSCVSVPQVETSIFSNSRATVALKVFSDPYFRASHPSTPEPSLLMLVLHGLYVEEEKLMLETALTGDPIVMRAFADDEIRLLTPHLAAALAEATPEEQVIFRLLNETRQGPEQTEGSLYVSKGTFHVTLMRYHLDPSRPVLLSYPSPSFSRPKPWRLRFDPDEALLEKSAHSSSQGDDLASSTLVISIARLTEAAEARSRVSGTSASSVDDQEKQRQIEDLQEEVHELRRSIREQDRKLERLEEQVNPDQQ